MVKDWEDDEEVEKDTPVEEAEKDRSECRTALETTYKKAEETSWAHQAPGTGRAEQPAPALCAVPWKSLNASSHPSATPEGPRGRAAGLAGRKKGRQKSDVFPSCAKSHEGFCFGKRFEQVLTNTDNAPLR